MIKSGFLPIYKMPTKLILLTGTLMELAQGFHKQNLIDQRDIERWDLKPSQHDPTCRVYYVLVLILTWSDMVWHGNVCGTTGRPPFAVFFSSAGAPEWMAGWQHEGQHVTSVKNCLLKEGGFHMSQATRFSLTNCASTCLKHDKIRFFTNLENANKTNFADRNPNGTGPGIP